MLGAKGLVISNFKDFLFQSTKLNSKEIVIVDRQFQNGNRRCIIYVCFGLQGLVTVPFRAHALGFYLIKCTQQRKSFFKSGPTNNIDGDTELLKSKLLLLLIFQ